MIGIVSHEHICTERNCESESWKQRRIQPETSRTDCGEIGVSKLSDAEDSNEDQYPTGDVIALS
jgi:hypothetical protein